MSEIVHVIDDDEGVRDSIVLLLRTYGFDARAHLSAVDFLDHLAAMPPGCVITDVQMPDMSGLDVLARLEPRRAEFPTIVLTGEGGRAMAIEALQAGAADFLEKPFDGDAICAAIGRALAQAKG